MNLKPINLWFIESFATLDGCKRASPDGPSIFLSTWIWTINEACTFVEPCHRLICISPRWTRPSFAGKIESKQPIPQEISFKNDIVMSNFVVYHIFLKDNVNSGCIKLSLKRIICFWIVWLEGWEGMTLIGKYFEEKIYWVALY